jgi:hypothetical protein
MKPFDHYIQSGIDKRIKYKRSINMRSNLIEIRSKVSSRVLSFRDIDKRGWEYVLFHQFRYYLVKCVH